MARPRPACPRATRAPPAKWRSSPHRFDARSGPREERIARPPGCRPATGRRALRPLVEAPYGSRGPPAQISVQESFDIAVQHALKAADVIPGARVLDALVGMQEV